MKKISRLAAMALTLLLLPVALAGTASAASPYAATFSATAAGGTVTGTISMTSTVPTLVTAGGICATGADGTKYAFPKLTNFTLTRSPTTFTTRRTVPLGQVYTYWTCLLINGSWTSAPGTKSIFVAPAVPATVDNRLPIGNLPGLTQTFAEDFTTNAAAGAFASAYAAKWTTYNGFNDTSGLGRYDNNAMSAHNGVLDESLIKTADGITHVAALGPVVTTRWAGQVYGRFSVRFKADAVSGFKTAFLLWPDSNIWNQGEVDFPEGNLTDTMWGYNHCVGNPTRNCTYTDTGVTHGSVYHTLTIDWKPTSLTFTIDGRISNTTTTNIPTHPMHWVLQTEANGARVTTNGHLLIDWATVYRYTPGTAVGGQPGQPTTPPPAARVISLRSGINGRYVTAEQSGAKPLIANRPAIGPWEQFDVIAVGAGRVALRAHANRRFVSADRAGGAPLIANRDAIGPWETFTLVRQLDGTTALLAAANGRWVTAERAGTQPLIANRTAVGPWEKLTIVGG